MKIAIAAIIVSAAAILMFAVVLSYRYPLGYEREIKASCLEFGVDENLVRGVIRTESGYNPKAVSGAGAVGLMQLMPQTAAWTASKLGDEELAQRLDDPAANIRLGVAHLKYLLGKFSEKDALAAYNAGEGNVARWIAEGREEYGFEETRNYVKRVLKAKKIYEQWR